MLRCPNCGNNVMYDNYNWCPWCGANLRVEYKTKWNDNKTDDAFTPVYRIDEEEEQYD